MVSLDFQVDEKNVPFLNSINIFRENAKELRSKVMNYFEINKKFPYDVFNL